MPRDLDIEIETRRVGYRVQHVATWTMTFEDLNWLVNELPAGDTVTLELREARERILIRMAAE